MTMRKDNFTTKSSGRGITSQLVSGVSPTMKLSAIAIVLVLLVGLGYLLLRSNPGIGIDALATRWPPESIERANTDRIAREKVRKQNPKLFAAVSAAMFQHDPIGINFKTNTDEYDLETGTVIPRLEQCSSANDVTTVLHEEFTRWFGSDLARDRSRYAELAKDIWSLWQRYEPNRAPQGTPATGRP